MKTLLSIAVFAFSIAVAVAATITGDIIDQTGAAKTGAVTIRPLSSPALIGSQYVAGSTLSITLTNGGFTNSLIQGDYLLIIAGVDSPRISVPDSTNTYNFIDLINTNGLTYTFKSPGSVVKFDQYDSTFGFLGDKLSFVSPLLSTTNNFGVNESLSVALDPDLELGTLTATNGITGLDLTASRATVTDSNKKLASITTTSTELGYVAGVTSAIQTQLNSKQASSTNLTAVASGGGIAANLNALGATNATLPGIVFTHDFVSTNGVTTGAPAGGTAATWKFGTNVLGASVTLNTTNYVEIDIGGTLYKLGLVQ